MIKRILILVVVLLLIVPTSALANDAYWYDYDSDKLQILVTRLQDDFSIGEDYSFKVTMINTTKWKMKMHSIDCFLFEDDESINDINPEADLTLSPGEKLTVTCTTEVPYNITWRKEKDDFYFDLVVSVDYTIFFPDDNDIDSDDYVGGESVDKPVAIKINNIYDGSDMLSMDALANNYSCLFLKDWDNVNNEEYDGSLENTITVVNLTDYTFKNLLVHSFYDDESPLLVSKVTPTSLSPSDNKQVPIESRFSIILENLPDSLIERYQAIFQIEDKYYAIGLEKEIKMLIASEPNIKITKEEIADGENSGKINVTIKNTSGSTYENFFISETLQMTSKQTNKKVILNDDIIIPSFKNKDSKEYMINHSEDNEYILGYTLGDYLITCKIEFYENESNEFSVFYRNVEVINEFIFMSQLTPSPTPTLTPNPTASQTASPSPSPTPAPTGTPAPSPTINPTKEPALEVVSIEKSSSIPFWVWIVLGAAIIGAGVVIFIIKKKRIAHDD